MTMVVVYTIQKTIWCNFAFFFQMDSDVSNDQIFYYFSRVLKKPICEVSKELRDYVANDPKVVCAVGANFLQHIKQSAGYYIESMKCDNFRGDELTIALLCLCFKTQVAVLLTDEVWFVRN